MVQYPRQVVTNAGNGYGLGQFLFLRILRHEFLSRHSQQIRKWNNNYFISNVASEN